MLDFKYILLFAAAAHERPKMLFLKQNHVLDDQERHVHALMPTFEENYVATPIYLAS